MTNFPVCEFAKRETPFYAYSLPLLRETLMAASDAAGDSASFCVHYAVKANVNPVILKEVATVGFGADCVSGGEVLAALAAGFPADKIVFAGVGKTDREIRIGLDAGISCFNVESVEELEVIAELASVEKTVARIALRVNPNVDAHTHHHITTGLSENKFGINREMLSEVIRHAMELDSIALVGLHFHIGSQLLDMTPYAELCECVNEIQDSIEREFGLVLPSINVGGGLGVDYSDPDAHPVPDFGDYFSTFRRGLKLRPGQTLHFELGRSLVCQCGSLISRCVFVKKGVEKQFVILDAGMSELIRPALYGARHLIQNISAEADVPTQVYDVVGPVCESSDTFGIGESLPETHRGDLFAIRSAGAYGEVMSSHYNCRTLNPPFFF